VLFLFQPATQAAGNKATNPRQRNSGKAWVTTGLLSIGLLARRFSFKGRVDAGIAPADGLGDVNSASQHYAIPQGPLEGLDQPVSEHDHESDIVAAALRENEETVALWLAGSWRCNLAPSRDGEASWTDRHAHLLTKTLI